MKKGRKIYTDPEPYVAAGACSVYVSGLTNCQIGHPMGSVKWAEAWLKDECYVKRRVSLKRMSAKSIAKIVHELHTALKSRDDY